MLELEGYVETMIAVWKIWSVMGERWFRTEFMKVTVPGFGGLWMGDIFRVRGGRIDGYEGGEWCCAMV